MKRLLLMAVVLFGMSAAFCDELSCPREVSDLIAEMRATGGEVRSGYSAETGLFIVGVGRTAYKRGAVNKCREIARINAVRNVTAALSQSFASHDAVSLNMSAGSAGNDEASAFVSSLSESSINQCVKGLQIVCSGENASGEMEVFVYMTAKQQTDYSQLLAAQLKAGEGGVVKACGMDSDRAQAERNALRSAVEQVAGTLIVGKVSINEREEFHKRLASSAGALVEEYRIVSEKKVELEYKIEVVAKVSKRKLYENYRSYFKCLDNPAFFLQATEPSLEENFKQFFIDKGFTIVNRAEAANYVIKLNGRFRERPTPGIPSSCGTMLNLGIEIVSADGDRVLLKMSDCQSKDSEVLTVEQRHYEVSKRIFSKLEPRLHKAIQDMIVRMLDDKDSQAEQSLTSGMEF